MAEGEQVDVKEFYFKQMCKLRVFDSPPNLITDEVNLLAISNLYGFIFVAAGTEIKMINSLTIDKLTAAVDVNLRSAATNYQYKSISVGHEIKYISVSCDELTLAIVYKDGEQLLVGALDTRAFISQDPDDGIFAKGLLTKSPDTHVRELHWNPENPNLLAVCLSNGHVSLLELVDNVFKIVSSLSKGPSSYSVSWSPKGKHFIAGNDDGRLLFYDKTMKLKKDIEHPNVFGNVPHRVSKVNWISTHFYSVVYVTKQDDDPDPKFVIVTSQKDGPNGFTNYGDIFTGVSEDRKFCFYIKNIISWNLIMTVASNSFELAVVGKSDKWCGWQLADSGRAEMPLTDDDNETFPVGIAVSLNSILRVKEGEQEYPPPPLLLMLSTDGVLSPFQMVNRFSGANYNIIKVAAPLASDGLRKPRTKSPKKATSPARVETSSTTIAKELPALTAQVSKPAIPIFSFGSSAPLATPFSTTVTAKTTASAFNFSFSSQSTAYANPFSVPKAEATGLASTQPSFNFNLPGPKASSSGPVGQPPSTINTAQPFNFTFGKSTFGSTPPPQSSVITNNAATPSLQPAFSGFLQKTPVAPTSNPSFPSGGFAKPPLTSIASAPVTQPAFSGFTPKATMVPISAASTLSSGPSKSPSSSAFSVVSSQPPPNVSVTLIGSCTLPPTAAFQTVKATSTQPAGFAPSAPNAKLISAMLSNEQQKKQYAGVPTPFQTSPVVIQKSIPTAVRGSPAASPFQQGAKVPQVAKEMPQVAKEMPPAVEPAGVTGHSPSLATAQQTQPAQSSTPAQKVTPETRKVDRTSKAKQMAHQLQIALRKSIKEEIAHFSKELSGFQSSMANLTHSEDLIGTSEELIELRGITERAWRKNDGFRDISKEHKQEVAQIKGRMFETYDLLEETEMRKDKVQDPRYVHLLKSRSLDPVTTRQRKEIRAEVNKAECLVNDVNDALDAVWEERQQQRSKKRNRGLKTNGIHNIYRTMESIEEIANNLAERLEYTTLDAQKKRLISLNASLRSRPTRHDELSSSNSDVKDLSILPQSSITPTKSSMRVSPKKQAQLRSFLMRRPETPVRKSRYEEMIPKVVPKAASTPARSMQQQRLQQQQEPALTEPKARQGPVVSAPSTVAAVLERISSSPKYSEDGKVSKTPFRPTPSRVPTNTPSSTFITKVDSTPEERLPKAVPVPEPNVIQAKSPRSFGFSSQTIMQQKPANFSETHSAVTTTTEGEQQGISFKAPESVSSGIPKVKFSFGEEKQGPVRNLFGDEEKNESPFKKATSSSAVFSTPQQSSVSQGPPGAFSFSMSGLPRTTSVSFAFVKPSPSFDSLATAAAPKGGTTVVSPRSSTNGFAQFSFVNTTAVSGSEKLPTSDLLPVSRPTVTSNIPDNSISSSSGALFSFSTKASQCNSSEPPKPLSVSSTFVSSVFSVSTGSVAEKALSTSAMISRPTAVDPTSVSFGGKSAIDSSTTTATGLPASLASGSLFKTVTTPNNGVFSGTTAFSSDGALFGTKPALSASVAPTPLSTATVSPLSSGTFGKETTNSLPSFTGGPFGTFTTPSLDVSSGTLDNNSTANKSLFEATVSTAAGISTFGFLGASSTSASGLFDTKTATTTFSSVQFGTPATLPSSGLPIISSAGTSTLSNAAPTNPTATSGLFTSSLSSGGLFGSISSSTQNTNVFGGTLTTSSSGLLGTTAATSTTSTSFPIGGETTSSGGGLFSATTTSSGGLFGSASTSSTGLFNSQNQAPGGLFSSQASGGLFAPKTSSGGLFGSTATSSTSGGLFGTSTPSTGLFSTSSSTAIGVSSAAPSFGFGTQQPQQSSSGLGFAGFGLGGKPTKDPNKNPFGSVPISATSTSASTLFDSSSGGGGLFSSQGGREGTFSKGFGTGFASVDTGVGASGGFGGAAFGTPTPTAGSQAFGGAPAFGGSPSFGSSPSFGGAPAFGTPATFGSSPSGGTFGSGSPPTGEQTGAGFAAMANQSGVTFGGLAAQQGPPPFGGMANQQNQGGFSGGQNFGSPQPSSGGASFSSWR